MHAIQHMLEGFQTYWVGKNPIMVGIYPDQSLASVLHAFPELTGERDRAVAGLAATEAALV